MPDDDKSSVLLKVWCVWFVVMMDFKLKRGRKKTVPNILKMANACTLLFANVLTTNAEKGVRRVNRRATGIYER